MTHNVSDPLCEAIREANLAQRRPPGIVLSPTQHAHITKDMPTRDTYEPVGNVGGPITAIPYVIRGSNEACPVGWLDLRTIDS